MTCLIQIPSLSTQMSSALANTIRVPFEQSRERGKGEKNTQKNTFFNFINDLLTLLPSMYIFVCVCVSVRACVFLVG